MKSLEEIKGEICLRIERFDVKEIFTKKVNINQCNNINDLFNYVFVLNNNERKEDVLTIFSNRLKSNVFAIDNIIDWFGEDFLTSNHVYCYGEHRIFGGYKNIFAIGTSTIEVGNDAQVFSFQNATVNLTQKSQLYATDNSRFTANNYSNVYIHEGSNVRGVLYNTSSCENYGNDAFIEAHDNSIVETYNHSCVNAFDSSLIKCYDQSSVNTYNGNVCVILKNYSNCFCCEPTIDLLCEDNSTAYIFNTKDYDRKCNCGGHIEVRDDSTINVYTKTPPIKSWNHAVVKDYTDIHCHPFDSAFVLWMNKMRAWYDAHDNEYKVDYIKNY